MSEAPGNITLPTDAAGNTLDPITGQPLGSLLDLPGAVITNPPAAGQAATTSLATRITGLSDQGKMVLVLGGLAVVGLFLALRED